MWHLESWLRKRSDWKLAGAGIRFLSHSFLSFLCMIALVRYYMKVAPDALVVTCWDAHS
jgi:hypothetical protein